MTIKDFAMLCGCNPQTLRYYDQIGLLKPERVDPWTGYRHYGEPQALAFVRIRNLQEAGFRIEEIKALLGKSDADVCHAIEKKLEEETARLARIREIHDTYLSQMTDMEKRIRETREKVRQVALQTDPEEEFGIPRERYLTLIATASDCLEASLDAMQLLQGDVPGATVSTAGDGEAEENPLPPEAYATVFEKHGWKRTREALQDLPALTEGEYLLNFELEKAKADNMAFPAAVMEMVTGRNGNRAMTVTCEIRETRDGQNHFRLMKKKQ